MSEQIFQVGIKGLIRNDKGQILMVHIPQWSGNKAHWDLPGGRMDPGENFLDTLSRELIEEVSVTYSQEPKQLMAFRTNITIPVGDTRIPLIFVIYEVKIADTSKVKIDPKSAEDAYDWFDPKDAAKEMEYKFSQDFCKLVKSMK